MISFKDLDAPDLSGKNILEKFELSLPFCRTPVKFFVKRVRKAEKAAGGAGFVTLDTLKD